MAFGKADFTVKGDTKLDSKGFKSGLSAMGVASGQLIAGLAKSAARGAMSFAKMGIDFEAGMSKVAAISGATGKNLEALAAKAKEIGKNTQFSATEATEAFNYMAMAGWDDLQMLEGVQGVMDLAAASGEDLATTSDIVTDALTAFGMEAEESTHFADVLAATSASANTNVSMMGESFKYVAPLAGALGFSVEDVAENLGLMANAGIKGSQAGTTMRSTLTRLAKPTREVEKALEQMGLTTEGVLTDAEGNTRSLADVNDILRGSFSKLTKTQKTQVAAQLAGKEAMSGFLAVMNATPEDIDKVSGAIADADGSAAEMAETMNDNLGGAIKRLKSAWEGLGIALYEGQGSMLQSVADNGAHLINIFTDAFEKGGFSEVLEVGKRLVDELIDGIAKGLPDVIEGAVSTIYGFDEGLIDSLDVMVDGGIKLLKALADGIVKAIPKIIEKAPEIVKKFIQAIGRNFPKILKTGGEIVVKLATGLIKNLPVLLKKAPKIIDDLVRELATALVNVASAFWDMGKNIVMGIWEGIKESWSDLVDGVKDLFSGLVDNAKGWLGIHSPSVIFKKEIGYMIPEGVAVGVKDKTPQAVSAVEDMAARVAGQAGRFPQEPPISQYTQSTITNNKGVNIYVSVAGTVDKQDGYKIGSDISKELRMRGIVLA